MVLECIVQLAPYTGWGEYLGEYLTIPAVNEVVAGRSTRSYTGGTVGTGLGNRRTYVELVTVAVALL